MSSRQAYFGRFLRALQRGREVESWVLSDTKIGKLYDPETGASEEKVTLMNTCICMTVLVCSGWKNLLSVLVARYEC